jgi:ABC-2 type transport system permease protein
MRKFLKYEMDKYLRTRGTERLRELPLKQVESTQGYVHYQKGSVVMYYLKEMIGEDKVNAALRSLIERFAYQGPPYPTSVDLVEALRAQTPDELQYLLHDLFDQITIFGNRTLHATYRPLPDNRFEVELSVECHKYSADGLGAETELSLDDWIEIGAFAPAEPGFRYGATLYRERLRMKQGDNRFTFVVDQIPDQVGVDPFYLLIDRMPEDNLKKPTRSAN